MAFVIDTVDTPHQAKRMLGAAEALTS